MGSPTVEHTAVIHATSLYPLPTGKSIARLTPTRMAAARKQGFELPTLKLGNCRYVLGADLIAFMMRIEGLEMPSNFETMPPDDESKGDA